MSRDRDAGARRRLRLHRETLRDLGEHALAGVAGGTEIQGGGLFDTLPKTNAWTGGIDYQPLAICTPR